MAMPLSLLFYLFVGLAFIVVGQLQYFARIDKAFWIPYLLGLVFYLRLILLGQPMKNVLPNPRPLVGWLRLSLYLFVLFIITAIASSLINGIAPLQWLVAGKEYFFLWGIFLAFLIGALNLNNIEKLISFIPWFLALQVPVVVYQRYVVAARRSGDSPWDAVVGLFGGDPMAGGASGTMAIFSLIAMALLVEAWKAGKASGVRVLVACGCAFAACALAEVKLVIVLMPILLLLIFGAEIGRRPVIGFLGLIGGLVLTVGLLVLYQQQFTSSRAREGKSLLAYVETTFSRNSDTHVSGNIYGDLGRAAAIQFWLREQSLDDPAGVLVGHGIGSSRIGGLVVGDLIKRYHVRIARSALVIYLWETGLLGTGALVAGLAAAIMGARRLSRLAALQQHAWLLRGTALGLGLVLLTLAYGPDFVEVSQMQVITFLLLGVVVAAARQRQTPQVRR